MKNIFVLLIAIISFSSCSSNPDSDINARVMMWQFVEGQLKDPSSAEFGTCKMTKTATGSWSTDCYVDAKNGFGGTERLNFYCEVKHIEGDKWELIDLNFK